MNTRQTSSRIGLGLALLLFANGMYFRNGIHRPLAWLFVCIDVIFIACAIFAFASAKRQP